MATAVHPTKKKAKCLTISEKLELLEDHASSRMTGSQLATKYSVNKATVSRILAQKQQLRLQCEKRHNLRLKRLPRKTAFQGINSAIEKIILQSSDGGKESALTGPIIQEMAKKYALEHGIEGFKASDGWLHSFRSRRLITLPPSNSSVKQTEPAVMNKVIATPSDGSSANISDHIRDVNDGPSSTSTTAPTSAANFESVSDVLLDSACEKGIQTDNSGSSIQSIKEKNKDLARIIVCTSNGALAEASCSCRREVHVIKETNDSSLDTIPLQQFQTISSPTYDYYVLEFLESRIIGQVARCWRKGTNDTVAIKVVPNTVASVGRSQFENNYRSDHSIDADFLRIFESFQYEDFTCYVIEVVKHGPSMQQRATNPVQELTA